jgi:hypothetical protein
MKISITSKKSRQFSKKKVNKFLFLPLYHDGNIFWLENVTVKKSFNGRYYQTIDVVRKTKTES